MSSAGRRLALLIGDQDYLAEAAADDATSDAIRVVCDDLAPADLGTILIFTGTADNGDTIRFAVDSRSADGLVSLIEDLGPVDCAVESWQILTRST